MYTILNVFSVKQGFMTQDTCDDPWWRHVGALSPGLGCSSLGLFPLFVPGMNSQPGIYQGGTELLS